jgi:hypothetical protein
MRSEVSPPFSPRGPQRELPEGQVPTQDQDGIGWVHSPFDVDPGRG